MRREPGLREDTKNLSVITGSALVALVLTVGFVGANATHDHHHHYDVADVVTYDIDMGPVSGSNRLYGTVVTTSGEQYTGFIRWDQNEGSWSDLLDANKVTDRGATAISGVRFGNVHRIETTGSNSALFVLKTGETVRMNGRATDLGSGIRQIVVDSHMGNGAVLDWRSMDYVEFHSAPEDAHTAESRLYGTVTTQSGQTFTGYVTWDIDEIYSSDLLQGEAEGVDHEIPFGAIAAIERYSNRAARVTLKGGEELVLSGTNDVNSSNNGITVSDVGLGQVKMDWSEFDYVRFHEADAEAGYGLFDGGQRLVGTVVDRNGREYHGAIAWDNDETFAWEMLNGDAYGVEFQIEFANIARIVSNGNGAMVELRDGRQYALGGSNDVDNGNRGITITDGGNATEVEWRDFRELRFTR